jgi:RNA polymerase sigma factor (sigma-70 family)
MSAESANSFDDAMARLKAGDQQAARQVFERYVQRLIALASARLGGKFRRKVDPEEVVQSVFNSFFHRHRDDQYELTSWDGLWGLLAAITIHKCGHKIEHFQAARRDLAKEASSPLVTDESRSDWEAIAGEPTAEQVAILDETIVSLLRELDERSGQIFLLVLQGWSTEEIGNEVRCSERTARRVLNRVRRRLEEVRDEPA